LIFSAFYDYIVLMKLLRDISDRLGLLKEFWAFVRCRKRYWLLPIMIFLIILSMFIILAEGSALAPFIYTIF